MIEKEKIYITEDMKFRQDGSMLLGNGAPLRSMRFHMQ